MQAVALAGATQSALKHHKKLLADVLVEVQSQTDLEEIEFAKVERIKPRTLIMTALLFGAVWFLIPQLAELPRIMVQMRGANWSWAIPALFFSMLTYVGAAMALSSSVPTRLSVAKSTLVTLAGSFVNRISPAKVGGIALNVRYLQKQGFATPVAAASVGLYQTVGLIVHLSLLTFFAIWAGHTISMSDLLPSGTIIFTVIAIVMTAIGLAIAIPKLRHLFKDEGGATAGNDQSQPQGLVAASGAAGCHGRRLGDSDPELHRCPCGRPSRHLAGGCPSRGSRWSFSRVHPSRLRHRRQAGSAPWRQPLWPGSLDWAWPPKSPYPRSSCTDWRRFGCRSFPAGSALRFWTGAATSSRWHTPRVRGLTESVTCLLVLIARFSVSDQIVYGVVDGPLESPSEQTVTAIDGRHPFAPFELTNARFPLNDVRYLDSGTAEQSHRDR